MVRRRGLARTAARTAVIAGTATSVSGRVARSQQQKFAGGGGGGRHPAPLPHASHAANGDDVVCKLQQLADLKAAGALNDKEFAVAKAKLLEM